MKDKDIVDFTSQEPVRIPSNITVEFGSDRKIVEHKDLEGMVHLFAQKFANRPELEDYEIYINRVDNISYDIIVTLNEAIVVSYSIVWNPDTKKVTWAKNVR